MLYVIHYPVGRDGWGAWEPGRMYYESLRDDVDSDEPWPEIDDGDMAF